MELRTRTPPLKESQPTVQKVMETFPRDSASLERLLALAKALRVRRCILQAHYKAFPSYSEIFNLIVFFFASDTADLKRAADHDESPPLTPTGNAPSSESELDISSPNASHDESQAKDQANRDSDKDLSHRPKRRRCHETYNFTMKCPTPGCNSLGKIPCAFFYIFQHIESICIMILFCHNYCFKLVTCLFYHFSKVTLQGNMNAILLCQVVLFIIIFLLMSVR